MSTIGKVAFSGVVALLAFGMVLFFTYEIKERPANYLQYEDSTLASIQTNDWSGQTYYGYISNEEYERYKNGDEFVLTLKHPFKEDSEQTVPVDTIAKIVTGVNKGREQLMIKFEN